MIFMLQKVLPYRNGMSLHFTDRNNKMGGTGKISIAVQYNDSCGKYG